MITTESTDCVAFAANETLQRCQREKETVIWYDEGMVRYSNQSIVGEMRVRPAAFLWNTQENQVSKFNESLAALLIDVAVKAASSSRKFATEKANSSYNIALLCVQDDSSERPSMDNILVMMNSFTVTLPIPKRSGFLLRTMRDSRDQRSGASASDQSETSKSLPLPVDDSSITIVYPR